MLQMTPFRQTPSFCGPASLKILLGYYGKDYSEAELGKICRTTTEKGTNHADLLAGIRKLGYEPVAKENATLEDLKEWIAKDTPVIVGWWSTDDDHYSVVYGIDDRNIYLMDPELDEGRRSMPIEDWLKVWYDFEGELNVKVDRWMVAVPKP